MNVDEIRERHSSDCYENSTNAIGVLLAEIDKLQGLTELLTRRQKEDEEQLVWLANWCWKVLGVENNSVIGRNGWPHRLVEVVAKAAEERLDKLQKFKDWVHNYLDQHNVPHHPPGAHGAAGCRIGDRMDWLMEQVDWQAWQKESE